METVMNKWTSRTLTAVLLAVLFAVESETAKPGTLVAPQPVASLARELIGDSSFERGCILWEPKTGSHVEYGRIAGVAKSGSPVWGLAQWSSHSPTIVLRV